MISAGRLAASAQAATSSFPAVATIVALILVVVVAIMLLAIFGRLSWRVRGRKAGRRLRNTQRAAADDIAELRAADDYDPDGPGVQPEDDL
jgi:hypothetical protein